MRGKFESNSVVSQHWKGVLEKKQTMFCEMRIAPNSVVSVFEQMVGGVLKISALFPLPGVRPAFLR
jgi:hypothetical protein